MPNAARGDDDPHTRRPMNGNPAPEQPGVFTYFWLNSLENLLNAFVELDPVFQRQTAVLDGLVVRVKTFAPYQVFYLLFTADRIEVRQDDRGFSNGDAVGKPAFFRQKLDPKAGVKPEAGAEYAEGWAERIEYDGRGDKLRLVGQARLKRGEEELRGNLITYDGATSFYQAQGSISGSPGRVRAVIRPKNNTPAKP